MSSQLNINSPRPSRILHTMIRVGELERSLNFYCQVLGMKELRHEKFPDGRFTLVFLGYGDEASNTVLELTHNWDKDNYQQGTGYGHLALAVPDLNACCENLQGLGINLTREPGPMAFTAPNSDRTDIIAFIRDPDGYTIELIEKI